MADKVKAVPKGFRTVNAYLTIAGAAQALEFYKKAFNAKEILRMMYPDGQKLAHAEIKIGNTMVMLSDEAPEMGVRSPKSIGGTGVRLVLYVRNCDRVYKRALKAGATSVMEPVDMFWGDRWSEVTDPSGHRWQIATHKEDLTPEQLEQRSKEFFAKMAQQQQQPG
ncbi:VOC family protein [Acidobacteriia bacterium AH_259_A11_L15]|nr:VOC family protein [Acidobacteriia bacterium AH_259_A11_L15]